jgi:hypothetical protein
MGIERGTEMGTLHVDCDTCVARGAACGDCVVTVLLGASEGSCVTGVVDLDPDITGMAGLCVATIGRDAECA